jgi:DNA polymerase-3 subunit epsilon
VTEPIRITDATFTVIDLETTGGAQIEHTIIEVAALKVRGGELIDELTTLVNPQQPISYFISQYTGITNDMVRSAPRLEEVLPRLLALIGDSVFVAHNISFDLRFLNMELKRHGKPALQNPALCTVRLARRLLPKQQRKSLGELAQWFGIVIKERHRARGDAMATVQVLQKLIEIAAEKHDIEYLDELLSLQFQPMRYFKKEPAHIRQLRERLLPTLPEKPGVYLMRSAVGEVLYVGKSKNLKARISSYFTSETEKPEKIRELMRAVRAIDIVPTGSELEALLTESRLIKAHRPRYNTLLKRYKSYPFLRLSAHRFPRLEITMTVQDDGAEYFGPFPSMQVARDVCDVLSKNSLLRECSDEEFQKGRACLYLDLQRCLAPCERMQAVEEAYQQEVERVRRFLSGEDSALIALLTEKMKQLANELRFEEAAELRSKIHSLKRVFYRQADIISSVNENNLLIILPSEKYSERCKEFVVLFIRFGRLKAQHKISPDEVFALEGEIRRVFFSGEQKPERCEKEEIDEMHILSSWIYHNRESLACLYMSPYSSAEHAVMALAERLAELSGLQKVQSLCKAEGMS